MNCSRCGGEMSDDNRFCQSCGASAEGQAPPGTAGPPPPGPDVLQARESPFPESAPPPAPGEPGTPGEFLEAPRRRISVPLIVGIVVLAILVVAAAVSGPIVIITLNARQVAQRNTCISNQRNVEAAIQEYAVESPDENYPSSLQDLVNANLIKSAPTCPSGHKPYIWVKGQPGIAPYISCPNNSTHEQ